MKYYAFQYLGSKVTTAGLPNIRTGRYNIAGDLMVFKSKADRDFWVYKGKLEEKPRTKLYAKHARNHRLGLTEKEYKEYINMITVVTNETA